MTEQHPVTYEVSCGCHYNTYMVQPTTTKDIAVKFFLERMSSVPRPDYHWFVSGVKYHVFVRAKYDSGRTEGVWHCYIIENGLVVDEFM